MISAIVRDAIKRRRHLHRAARNVRVRVGHFLPPRQYPPIPGRVHFNDFMLTGRSTTEIASYRDRALNVLDQIELSLSAADRTFQDVGRWLDFGCGYGRVIRFLVQRVPPGRIFASDVLKEGVDFCASEFGVHPLYSRTELATLRTGLRFDFIYAISVLTHLNRRNSEALLELLGTWLEPDGIALFTTHGKYSLENTQLYGDEYAARRKEITDTVARDGMAFVQYPYATGDDYGMAWHSTEWIESTIERLHAGRLRLVRCTPHGLDGHQDVVVVQRRAE